MKTVTLNFRDGKTEPPSAYDSIVMAVRYKNGRVEIQNDIGYSVDHQMRYTPNCKIVWIPTQELKAALFQEDTDAEKIQSD